MGAANRQDIEAEFRAFDALDAKQDSEARKQMVRKLERGVRSGEIVLTKKETESWIDGDHELARILVYLLAEYDKINATIDDERHYLRTEWGRLRRHELSEGMSRMPLYYAIRSFISRIKSVPEDRQAAMQDRHLVSEIHMALRQSSVDRKSQLVDRIGELQALLDNAPKDGWFKNPLIIAAVIAAVATLGAAVVSNWDKISGTSPPSTTGEKP